eukprot:10828-Pelagococcus_subviridis.AAC.1
MMRPSRRGASSPLVRVVRRAFPRVRQHRVRGAEELEQTVRVRSQRVRVRAPERRQNPAAPRRLVRVMPQRWS